jgi:hypothetical protein
MNPKIIRKIWRMSKKIDTYWSVYFAIDDELEKNKKERSNNKLASLVSS